MPSLQPLHTFALPAQCNELIKITDPKSLTCLDFSQPYYVLGEGSNTVFLENYNGTILHIANKGIELCEQTHSWQVRVSAGENWHHLVVDLIKRGVNGFENLALIPGTVGAAPVQNIGAYGVEVSKFIKSVIGYDTSRATFIELQGADCQFAYRESIFKHELKNRFIITEVIFELPKVWQPVLNYGPLQSFDERTVTAYQIFQKVIEIRQSKLPDPHVLANAGSFFKNPIVALDQARSLLIRFPDMPYYPVDASTSKLAAGWLIEQAGLKGFEINGIKVYDKQALVLVNLGHGSSKALKAMIYHIQKTVWQKFNVRLEHEVRVIAAHGNEELQGVKA